MACEVNSKEINSQCAELLGRPTYIPFIFVLVVIMYNVHCTLHIVHCAVHIMYINYKVH